MRACILRYVAVSSANLSTTSVANPALPTLVFDLDGTLVDTLPDLAASVNYCLEQAAMPLLTEESIRPMIGDGMRTLVERALTASVARSPKDSPSAQLERLEHQLDMVQEHYFANCCEASFLYEGVEETLIALGEEGWPLAVCTNKPVVPTMTILEKLGLADHFPGADGLALGAVIGGDSIPVKKPHPGHLLGALALSAGDENAGCIMVGDGPNDVKVARAAGFPVVGVSYGYTPVPMVTMDPDALIHSFPHLITALDRWRGDGRDAGRSL